MYQDSLECDWYLFENIVPTFCCYFLVYYGAVWIACPRFLPFIFSFFFYAFCLGRGQLLLFMCWTVLFTHCSSTVHAFKNIKNGSHSTIHTFKNYFTTVFSVFNFSKNKLYPNGPYIYSFWLVKKINSMFLISSSIRKFSVIMSVLDNRPSISLKKLLLS